MKFLHFCTRDHSRGVYGIVSTDGKIKVIRGGLLDRVERTGEIVVKSEITRYMPPVEAPNVFAIGRNYLEHAAETNEVPPTSPLTFSKPTTCLIGHNENIILPAFAPSQVDYEAELVAIIGKTAHKVLESEALDYVFGYTCGNDVTARDCQSNDGQWTRAKGFDTFGPIGPCVVTGLDPSSLTIRMRINGEIVQNQSTRNMIFSVARIVSYLSQGFTLLPGTAIFTGTPSGVGIGKKPPVFLKAGDVCEVEIDGIGVLKNQVALS